MPYLLDFTTILIFAFHLMAMNVASAGPLASIGFDWRRTDRAASHTTACYLGGVSLVMYLLGMLLGIGLLLLAWNEEQTRAIFTLLDRKIFFGVIELGFSLVLMAAYYFWLRMSSPDSPLGSRALRALLIVLAASNMLYHFPPLFAVAASIADGYRPDTEHISPAMFRQLLASPKVASQSVHFVLASLAAAGIMVLGFALRLRRQGGVESEAIDRIARVGGWLALAPTLLQILVGMWVLLSLPTGDQQRLMGGDWPATGLFLLSLAAALGLMHSLGSIAMGDCDRRNIARAMAAFGITVVLMTGVLYLV